MQTSSINSEKAPPTLGGYSQALAVTGAQRLVYVSGQVPETRDGEIPESFDEQARVAWNNVLAQLDAAGMDVTNLVKVTTFLSSRDFAGPNSAVRQAVLGDHAPALTVIITGIFDERWLLEIEAIAAG